MKRTAVKENFTLQQARGERLRRLRNMANLSREELCDVDSLNAATYKGWEIGRFGGLSFSGAREVIDRVAKEGVICSLDWLLNGEGCGPFVVADTSSILAGNSRAISTIQQEIIVFQNNYKEGIFLEILDDGMFPQYCIGDRVAGVRRYHDEINSLVGSICIAQTADNGILVRQLLKGTVKNTYTLVCSNPKASVVQPVLCDIKISAAASIIRHYKELQ